MTQTSAPRATTTRTVGDGTATVTYDVHGDLAAATAERPALLAISSPMDASGFGTLLGLVTDRPVVTYDPRGAGRNPTGTAPITPEEHAGDLHRVIAALGVGPVDVFASSGGAVNALALVAAHPGDVRRVVAHEPPTAALLPDREHVLAAVAAITRTYAAAGQGQAMARFIALIMHSGELDASFVAQPAPDPAAFGLGAEDDGSRTHPMMRNMVACASYEPDLTALAALGGRLVLAVGAESREEVAARGARSVAAALGREAVVFPGGHAGFLGGEFGQTGEPVPFAARLLEVLDADGSRARRDDPQSTP